MASFSLWLLVIVLLAAAIAVVLGSRIQAELVVSRFHSNDRITVDVQGLFGLLRYRIHVPMINFRNLYDGFTFRKKTDDAVKATAEGASEVHLTRERIMAYYERIRLLTKNVFNLQDWMKQTLHRIECTHFVWSTRVGIGDAPETAVVTGLVWGVKASLLRFMFGRISLKTKPGIQVSPQYNMQTFSSELTCRLQIRVIHVLGAVMRLLPHIWKGKRDWESWQHIFSRPRLKGTG
ncbi:hypothetical protein SD70_28710 [Gordoniibacillus kamchatkensis]|uniref:DUF2953 domain-containing protein n=1 Tax=Gordoniibacillus kamchatkensis TaxID=1590651 RepID=A0ABR5AAT6_9BACL|nr:DUF2953 domain-containing protein [Paenibacillus sp. VKM B-2647]KIL38091.1 hypothetical protein SD70_28710 [Paenibacillus sp. VKM B-2647]